VHIKTNVVNIKEKTITPSLISIQNGVIDSIEEIQEKCKGYVLPGFIDAHIHIESSMLLPSEFARLAVIHGSVATLSDPHEIANVLGIEGVEFMLDMPKRVLLSFTLEHPLVYLQLHLRQVETLLMLKP